MAANLLVLLDASILTALLGVAAVGLVAVLAARKLRANQPKTGGPIDRAVLILSIVDLGALVFGLVDGETNGWARPTPLIAVAVALAAFGLLTLMEQRTAVPVLPPMLVALGRVRSDLITGAVASIVLYGLQFSLTLWLQDQRSLTPLQTGLAFLSMTLPMYFLPLVAGRLVARFGARRVIVTGLSADVLVGVLLACAGLDAPIGWVLGVQVAFAIGSTPPFRPPPLTWHWPRWPPLASSPWNRTYGTLVSYGRGGTSWL